MSFPFAGDTYSQTYVWRDAKGNTAISKFFIDFSAADQIAGSTFAFNLRNALAALTNAAFQAGHGLYGVYGVAQYGTAVSGGAYESVVDKAVLVFQDNAGTLHRFEVPAPKIAIFESDKITVNPGATGMSTLITQLTTPDTNGVIAVSRSGVAVVNYMGGFYKARKIRRRLNVLVLTPALTPSLPAE